jgi:FtsP/CotA-like multicopper oxidase with cupredoxin domain
MITDYRLRRTLISRRNFLTSSLAAASVSLISGRAQAASIPEAVRMTTATTQPPQHPTSGPHYRPVITLNGWSLPFRINGDWKEFHLVGEPIEREIAPGMKARLWGYNGQSPGPTIEAVEGDKVRIFVTNNLPEHTSVHWHGVLLPAGMDGVGGVTQPHIPSGRTFVYEFELKESGTFMYHPHSDEMVQMAMGMMGMFISHPRDQHERHADRDYAFIMSAYRFDPGTYLPKIAEMTDFNIWAWNSRVFPGIDPIVAAVGERVRIRMANLTMTNHPIHLHGHHFSVTGTDAGWIPETARWPESTTDVAVGVTRTIEFDAAYPGDWPIHCHKSHHTMNPMGHDAHNFIGARADPRLAEAIRKLAPGYMPMGATGMADMSAMNMPLPANTLPMMTGEGAFGPAEMGGMFSLVKIRDRLAGNAYRDPGPYVHPPGTVAHDIQEGPAESPGRKETMPLAPSDASREHHHH